MCQGGSNLSQMEPMVMLKRGSVLPASVVEEILTCAAAASAEAPNRALKRRVRQRLHKKLGSMLTAEEFEKAMERYSGMEDEASAHLAHASTSPSSSGATAQSPCTVIGAGNSTNMCPANPVTACQTFIAVPMMPLIAPMPVPQPQPMHPLQQLMGQTQPTLQPMLQPMQPVQPMGPMQPMSPMLQPVHPAQPMQAMQVQPMPAPAMMQLLGTDAPDAPAPSPKAQKAPADEISEDISQTASTIADNDDTSDDEDDLESISELSTEWVRAISQGSSECPVERTFIQFHTRVSGSHRRSRSV